MFYTAREINLTLNGNPVFCNQLALSQQANFTHPVQESESVSNRNVVNNPLNNELSFQYYLTGKDYLYDFIFTNHKTPISGNVAGIQFNQGYLKSYSLDAEPNSPLVISASILVADEVSGSFSPVSPSAPPNNLQIINFNDSYFSINNSYSAFSTDNISRFSWSFSNNITPVYFYKQSGENNLNPDRVVVEQKEISCDMVSDDLNIPLTFSGENIAFDFVCRTPNLLNSQTYSISGKINKKELSVSVGDTHSTSYSVTQSHLNGEPQIQNINTTSFPSNNYITITSPNLINGFFSTENGYPLVDKVILGDRSLDFVVARGATRDTITGYIPADAINGTLQIHTSKGLIIHPSPVTLNFLPITVDGFYPDTGFYRDTILISGTNFNRVSKVLFNEIPSNFNIYQSTGNSNTLIANVPSNATIGKISVVSELRGTSGVSTGAFYVTPEITGFTPTGTWSGTCIIAGRNFSGITNVYFNGVRSPNFTVNNNSRITATIPGTGAGYTKGFIKLSGYRGVETLSKTVYQPVVRITGMNLISGGVDEDIMVSGIFDFDFLYRENGGVRLSFGNEYSLFYRHDNFTISGFIPTGSFNLARPALFEPDGVGKYPPFTGNFIQVAAPIIEAIGNSIPNQPNFFGINQFQRKDMILYGKNFNYFFGKPFYVYCSGGGEVYTFADIQRNSDGTQLVVKNVRVTGVGNAGNNYPIYVRNAGGQSTQFFYVSPTGFPEGLEGLGVANRSRMINTDTSSWAIDNNYASTSVVYPFGNPTLFDTSGWWDITFNQVINFGAIDIYRDPPYAGLVFTPTPPGSPVVADTGMLQCFDADGASVLRTGISFTSRTVFDNDHVITGVKRLKLFRNINSPPVYLAFSEISIWD